MQRVNSDPTRCFHRRGDQMTFSRTPHGVVLRMSSKEVRIKDFARPRVRVF